MRTSAVTAMRSFWKRVKTPTSVLVRFGPCVRASLKHVPLYFAAQSNTTFEFFRFLWIHDGVVWKTPHITVIWGLRRSECAITFGYVLVNCTSIIIFG